MEVRQTRQVEAAQDEISYRRIMAYEVQRISAELEGLKEQQQRPKNVPWRFPTLFGILIAGVSGYIGIVHNVTLKNSDRIDITRERVQYANDELRKNMQSIADEQQRRTSLKDDVADIKRRMPLVENVLQQLPYIVQRIDSLDKKIDRLLGIDPPPPRR